MKQHGFLRSLALLLALACLLSTAAFADVDGCAKVTASALNLRSEASTSASVVAVVPNGSLVLVTEKGDDWAKVWYEGDSGYMSTEFLSYAETGTADFGTGTVSTDDVNIRSAASTSSSVVATVDKGTSMPVTGVSGQWYQVSYNGSTAYVRSDLMSLSAGSSSAGSDSDDDTDTDYDRDGSISGSYVCLRKGPSTSHQVLTLLDKGTQVKVGSLEGEFYQVEYNGTGGYVHKLYVSLSDSSGSSSAGSSEGTINGSYVRLRSGASLSSGILALLDEGESVTVKGTDGDFYSVDHDGTAGYVYKQYVSLEGEGEDKDDEGDTDLQDQDGRISGSYVRLRKGPSTSSGILAVTEDGDELTVTGTNGDWYAVEYKGSKGYIYKQYVTLGSASDSDSSSGSIKVDSVDEDEGTIRGSYVRVRTGPSTSSSIIATLHTGAKLEVSGITGEWYQVKYDGQTGYVYKSYLLLGEQSSSDSGSSSSGSIGEQIVAEGKKYLGVPYVYGGTSPSGFDCSGFVYYVYKQLGYSVYRTAGAQYRNGTAVDRSELQPGDIIIFYNSAITSIGHSGIYVGDGQFIHASSGSGQVIISDLSQSYYDVRFYGARRVV